LCPYVRDARSNEGRKRQTNQKGCLFSEVEMLNMMELWTGGLTIFVALIGYMMHEKFNELKRIDILLNKTREEVARDNVTKAEVERIVEHMDARFNKLESKIDELIRK
jgi:hypothetical protein